MNRTTLKAFGKSHPGLQRDNNEDRHYVDVERGLFMVIDGVGGHAAGEKAAETALQMLLARLERETGTPAERLREAMTLANNEIYRLASSNPEWHGMACVMTAALVADGVATIGHVGDSRLYEFRDGGIRKVTHDHSPVGEREDRGELGEQEAMRHPRRNEIYRDLGSEEHSPTDAEFIEVIEMPFEADRALLLCSDGLTDLVTSARLRQIVYENAGNRAFVVHRLIEAANEAGGKDNVTAVYVEGEGFAAAARASGVGGAGRSPDRGPSASFRAGDPGGYAQSGRGPSTALRAGKLGPYAVGPVLLLIGGLAGVGLSIVGVAYVRSLPAWLARAGLTLTWSRTWTVGPGPRVDFATITEALAAARPGDTVQVEPGDYRESIRFPGGVSLVGRRSREPVIRPPLDVVPGWTAIEADTVTGGRIANLRIAGDEAGTMAVGIRARHATVEIDNVEITGADHAAVEMEGRGASTLRASFLHHNPGVGVLVRAGATPRLLHNVVSSNGTRAAGLRPGVEIEEPARPVLFGNIVEGNGVDGVLGLATSDREAVVRDNTIGPVIPALKHEPAPKREPARRPEGRGKQ